MINRQKPSVRKPWKNVHAAIWLIGLAIIALNDWWWPGILFLVGISLISQAMMQMLSPKEIERIEENEDDEQKILSEENSEIFNSPSQQAAYSTHRLPSECPKCGAPIRGIEIRWTGPQSANCPYCGANLPLG